MTSDVGSLFRTSAQIRDTTTGALVSPATKVLTVTLPDQTQVTPTVTTDAVGLYHVDYLLTLEGLHTFQWVTTGPVTSHTDYENAIVYRSIVGLDEIRSFLNLSDTSRDDIMRQMSASVTELVESIVGTCVIRTFTDEHIPGRERPLLRLPRGPLPSATSVTSISSVWPNGPVWNPADLLVYPHSGTVEAINMQGFWFGPWKATYTAGRTVIPPRIVTAACEIIYDLWATQRGVSMDTIPPELTEAVAYETAMPSDYRIPAHAKALLDAEAMPGFA